MHGSVSRKDEMTHRRTKHESFSQPERLVHCHAVSPEKGYECQKFLAAYNSLLEAKTEELIKVALSVATQCEWGIASNVREALGKGASRQEVIDAARLAVLMTGAPALECMDLLQDAVTKFGPEPAEAL
jgi:AhpD family alkylhydroperoxidase